MNFEEIEKNSLAYLEQTTNPLVRVSVLYRHMASRSKEQTLSEQEFVDFLNAHSEIKVMDPLSMAQDDTTTNIFESVGFTTSPCAILVSRVPSTQDLSAAMLEQLESMTHALSRALEEARDTGDTAMADQIYETLERTSKLKDRIVSFTKAS